MTGGADPFTESQSWWLLSRKRTDDDRGEPILVGYDRVGEWFGLWATRLKINAQVLRSAWFLHPLHSLTYNSLFRL